MSAFVPVPQTPIPSRNVDNSELIYNEMQMQPLCALEREIFSILDRKQIFPFAPKTNTYFFLLRLFTKQTPRNIVQNNKAAHILLTRHAKMQETHGELSPHITFFASGLKYEWRPALTTLFKIIPL